MERGTDFLKSQINNAVMQHKTWVDSLEHHARQAEDPQGDGQDHGRGQGRR